MAYLVDLVIILGQTLSILVLLSLAYALLTAIYNVYFHPLRRFPGPKLWAAFRFPYVISLQRGDLHNQMRKIHDRFPELGIVRIAPNELSFTTPDGLKDVYLNRPGHQIFLKNDTWLKPAPGEPNNVMGRDEEDHARYRRLIAPAFTSSALKDQAPIIESHVDLLIRRFQEHTRSKQNMESLDVVKWINFLTFDIVGDLAFGEPFGCLRDSTMHPWVDIASNFGKMVGLLASINLYPPFNKLLRYILPKSALRKRQQHKDMTKAKVQQRLSLETQRPDFITAMTRYGEGDGKLKGITLAELEINMSILIFAGSETTASALSGILRMLVQNRGKEEDALSRLTAEVRGKFKGENGITLESVALKPNEMDYLQAVIDEGMRLCPPVAIGVPRVVPRGGDTICGHWVPGGTYVTYNQYPAYRSASNFHDPNAFYPSRWLSSKASDASSSRFSKDRKEALQSFNVGRHTCIGKILALAEIRLILTRLLWKFDLQLKKSEKEIDWGDQKTIIFWAKEPLRLMITERIN